jgi:hypothetical protein
MMGLVSFESSSLLLFFPSRDIAGIYREGGWILDNRSTAMCRMTVASKVLSRCVRVKLAIKPYLRRVKLIYNTLFTLLSARKASSLAAMCVADERSEVVSKILQMSHKVLKFFVHDVEWSNGGVRVITAAHRQTQPLLFFFDRKRKDARSKHRHTTWQWNPP